MEPGSTPRTPVLVVTVCVAGVLGLIALTQHATLIGLRAENQALRANSGAPNPPTPSIQPDPAAANASQAELLRLRAEIHQLREALGVQTNEVQALLAQQAELQQLREQSRDLLRLRNEVHQLHEQQGELEAMRAANAGLLHSFETGALTSQLAVIDSVRKQGAVLGVVMRSTDPNAPYPGAVVVQSAPGMPPSDLKPGDIIVGLDGRPVRNVGDIQAEMLTRKPGQSVVLDLIRDNSPMRISMPARAWPQP